jgi:hypothetical protein
MLVVTTLAGTGQKGNQQGAASKATFSETDTIVEDSEKNLFVLDGGNRCIRKISHGVVTVFAEPTNECGGDLDLVIDSEDNTSQSALCHKPRIITTRTTALPISRFF